MESRVSHSSYLVYLIISVDHVFVSYTQHAYKSPITSSLTTPLAPFNSSSPIQASNLSHLSFESPKDSFQVVCEICWYKSFLHNSREALSLSFGNSAMAHTDRRVTEQLPRYDCLIFDLDDTLYPLSSGLAAYCTKNIGDYVHEKLGVEKSEVVDLCTKLYKAHGTTMAGLRVAGFDFDYDDYHSFVHGRLPYENLRPDPVLRNLLLSMPQRKIVFTNGDKVHATKVLKRLGLQDCFEGIICFETLNPLPEAGQPKPLIVCKPALEAFDLALQLANADPSRSIFFDDSVRNIAAAKRAGLHTVLVGNTVKTEGADHALGSLHNMREALPEIWAEECAESSRKAVRSRRSLSMETVVTA